MVLGAVVHQRHAGIGAAHDLFGIDAAHGAESVEHIGAAFSVGAAVQQQIMLLDAGHGGSQGGALDPLDGAHDKAGGHMQRAGGTGGDEGVALAVFQHGQALHQAGVGLVAGGLDGVVLHGDHLGAGDDLKRRKVDVQLGSRLADDLFLAQQTDGHALAEFLHGIGSALQHGVGGVVAAHHIQKNLHSTSSCSATQAAMAVWAALESAM